MTSDYAATIELLDGPGAHRAVSALARVLCDCVDGGASVSFMAPLSLERASEFWAGVADSVDRDAIALFVASVDGDLVGTVQLSLALPENQPHRAEVAKLLVHRRARRRGVAESLMRAVEFEAIKRGRTLLTLDTASPAAERVYTRLGWQECGRIPGYALYPDGRLCDTVIYWKLLGTASREHPRAG